VQRPVVDANHGRTERGEHALGVIAARRGLDDLGRPRGLQTGEGERGLDLSTRLLELHPPARELAPADRQRGVLPVVGGDVRAQRAQRCDDSPHRTAPE
jgi:hypothetical protein